MSRMFVEGEFAHPESERMAATRLMRELDDHAAKHGMAVAGDVEISATEQSRIFAMPRTMRLEAEVAAR